MKSLSRLILALALTFSGLNMVKAQTPSVDDKVNKADEVNILVKNKNYVFEAEHTTPPGMKYRLKVSSDTISAHLPNLQFISTDFSYTQKPSTSGGWNIMIKPNTIDNTSSTKGIKMIFLHVNAAGYASLRINTMHGTSSYHGYIKQKGY